MDETFDVDDFVPGIFHLNLNINAKFQMHEVHPKKVNGRKINKSRNDKEDCARKSHLRDLTLRYESLRCDMMDDDVSDPQATLIFLGVLAYHLGKISVATEHFESVLEEDESNLNALSGLIYILAKSAKTQQRAAECKKKISDLLGRSTIEVSDEELSRRIAQCLSEQAYAHAYDVSLTSFEERRERILSAIDLYDQAILIGSSVISLEERWGWYFSMGSIFLSLDTLMIRNRERLLHRLPGYNRAINLLKEIIKSDHLYHSALSWAYLGVFLERQAHFDTTPMSVHDCGFTSCEPVDCYTKAIEIAEKNPTILNRLAKVFREVNKHELSIGAADMSLRLEPSAEKNTAAYRVRARVRMGLYMRDLSKCKYGKGSMPDRELLELAKKDLELISRAEVSPGLMTFIEIGQVCYFMGVDAFKESFIVDEEGVNSALVYFSKALGCEMGNILPQLQLLRGKCLKIKGEERNALECFKKAIELEKEGSTNSQAFRCLMETLLALFSSGEMENIGHLISDAENWIKLACDKYPHDVIIAELRAITHANTHELLDLCKVMIKGKKTILPKLCLSMAVPRGGDIGTISPTSEVNR